MTAASAVTEFEIFSGLWDLILASRTELLLFVAAMVAYFALFLQKVPTNSKLQAKKRKSIGKEEIENNDPVNAVTRYKDIGKKECTEPESALEAAFERGDYRSVLTCWTALKKCKRAPAVSLS